MALIALGLGTNLGNKEENLHRAIQYISDEVGKINKVSSFYASKPWGFESENNFINVVIVLDTNLSPQEVLAKTKEVEVRMGRKAKSIDCQYTDRIIDIDILLYDDLVLNTPELKIPHPLMQERDFVLCPLSEILPDFIHPALNKPIKALLEDFKSMN